MPERCELGDLVGRLGSLDLAGTIQRADSTRKVLTDTHLPLQGGYSIVGHSMVISDRHAPQHRGERMACTTLVNGAVACNWAHGHSVHQGRFRSRYCGVCSWKAIYNL